MTLHFQEWNPDDDNERKIPGVSAMLGKLGVHTRAQAIARERELSVRD